ncbi:hypothetical protein OHZ10_34450 [Burkholderia arboris]|uniref:Lipoprotein n=1 Tax=Burkholderia arboris TaxID=488730 RepID=A0ABZ3DXL6_9BURK|nr:hypothetical protein [Burkholderia arboris]MCA8493668.1 hypothetical protein [Burkholderia arboris]
MNVRCVSCLASIAVSTFLTGCVSVQPKAISQDGTAALGGKTIVVSTYETPSFSAMTPGKAMFGLIGGAVMISTGNSFVRDNRIADPAVAIGNGLAKALAEKYGVVVKPAGDAKPLATDALDVLVAQYPGNDLIMDSRTINWMYTYFPNHWGTYRLVYSAKIRLIDARSKTVLAEGVCSRVPEYSADLPDYDTLTGNGGAWVKEKLRSYADACVNEFGAASLALPQIASQTNTAQPVPAAPQ